MSRLKLSERVLDVQFSDMPRARMLWAEIESQIPASRRKDQVAAAVRSGEQGVLRETALRLYIWLEGYEAAHES